jgi:hypothetical protein
MNSRWLIITTLGIFMVAGLVAGLFEGSIERALIVPMTARGATIIRTKPPQPTPTAAATNVLAQDTFQRQDQALWGTASDMHRWEGDANNPNDSAIFSIANASGQIAHGQGTFNAVIGQSSTDEQAMLTGQINQFTNGANIGVALRWQDINNWYKAYIDGTHLRIIKDVQGISSIVSTVPFQAQDGVLYALRFRVVGTTLSAKAWQNGTPEPANWMITANDASLNSGQVGIRVLTNQDSVVTITSFEATTVNGAT